MEHYLEKIRKLTPLQQGRKKFNISTKSNYRVLNETKKISVAKDHLTKEEIKEYSLLYIIYNHPKIIYPRLEILKDIVFSSKSLNNIKGEILELISKNSFNEKSIEELNKKYLNLIEDINKNSVIRNIFLKKSQQEQIELLNEILKELNEIKFTKKIDVLENKLIKDFDEKSFSDLMELKSQINKE